MVFLLPCSLVGMCAYGLVVGGEAVRRWNEAHARGLTQEPFDARFTPSQESLPKQKGRVDGRWSGGWEDRSIDQAEDEVKESEKREKLDFGGGAAVVRCCPGDFPGMR